MEGKQVGIQRKCRCICTRCNARGHSPVLCDGIEGCVGREALEEGVYVC